MKNCAFLALLGLTAAAPAAFAATNVSYTATADPNLSPDGVDNNGNAVDVWTLTHIGAGTSPGNYGSFPGDSSQNGGGSGAGAGSLAWGIYANGEAAGAASNEVDIDHTFVGGMLTASQTVSIQFDGGYVDGSGDQYGLRLFGPGGSFVLSLSFLSGDNAYRYYDAGSSGNSAGFGYYPNGFTFNYTQLTATTYSAAVVNGTTTLGSWTGTVSGAPSVIEVYNDNAGGPNGSGANYDVFANNLSVVPEPRTVAILGAGIGLALLGWRRRIA